MTVIHIFRTVPTASGMVSAGDIADPCRSRLIRSIMLMFMSLHACTIFFHVFFFRVLSPASMHTVSFIASPWFPVLFLLIGSFCRS
jgi:hypothetical protein